MGKQRVALITVLSVASWGGIASAALAGKGGKFAATSVRSRLRRSAVTRETSQCSCDCCDVIHRRPDEVVDNVFVKCWPSHAHSLDVCGIQCTVGSDDAVFGNDAKDTHLDYQQFCFFECRPADGNQSLVGTQCLALEAAVLKQSYNANGPIDPAGFYNNRAQPAISSPAALLMSTANSIAPSPLPVLFYGAPGPAPAPFLGAPAPATAPAPSPAEVYAGAPVAAPWGQLTGSLAWSPSGSPHGHWPADAAFAARQDSDEAVAKAVDMVMKGWLQAQEAGKDTREATDKAHDLQKKQAGPSPLKSLEQIEAAVGRSTNAMQNAIASSRNAELSRHASEDSSWNKALSAANVEVTRLATEMKQKMWFEEHPVKTWAEYAAETSAKAAKPYLDASVQSQQVAQQWHLEAQEAINEVKALERTKNDLSNQEDLIRLSNREEEKNALEAEKAALDAKAVALQSRAAQMTATAEAAARSANEYYKLANEAARRAGESTVLPAASERVAKISPWR